MEQITEALIRLHHAAGAPTSRTIAETCDVSHTTIAAALRGAVMPRLPTLLEIVSALGGDLDQFIEMYPAPDDAPLRMSQRDLLEAMLEELRVIRILLVSQQGADVPLQRGDDPQHVAGR